MNRGERRHRRARALRRRLHVWKHVWGHWRADSPMPHVFRESMQPCSCPACTGPRYDRTTAKREARAEAEGA